MGKPRFWFAAVSLALAVTASACATSPIVTPVSPTAAALAPVNPEEVQYYDSEAAIPFEYVAIATISPRRAVHDVNNAALRPYREIAARKGANALTVSRTSNGRIRFLALHLTSVARQGQGKTTAPEAATSTGSSGSSASSGGCTGSCDVHVRGYTRRDGTYVHPHTRSHPGGGGGRRH